MAEKRAGPKRHDSLAELRCWCLVALDVREKFRYFPVLIRFIPIRETQQANIPVSEHRTSEYRTTRESIVARSYTYSIRGHTESRKLAVLITIVYYYYWAHKRHLRCSGKLLGTTQLLILWLMEGCFVMWR